MSALKVLGIIGLAFVSLLFLGLIYIGKVSPDTKVVSGAQLEARFMKQIRALKLLDEGEQLRLFYSDALTDVTEGMYFLTDRKLVLHSQDYATPTILIPLTEIADVRATYSDDWVDPTMVWVTLKDGAEHSFPLSNEGGGDKQFVKALQQAAGVTPEG
jgi:hypothetical protein